MKTRSLAGFINRLALVLVIAVLPLVFSGCWLFSDSDVARNIKDATGIDPNDPKDLVSALSGGTKGNKDQDDALEVVAGFQRARHEQKGDELLDHRDPYRARDEYKKALEFTHLRTVPSRSRVAKLNYAIGRTYEMEALSADIHLERAYFPNLGPQARADWAKTAAEKYQLAAQWHSNAASASSDPVQYAGYEAMARALRGKAAEMAKLAAGW